METLPGKQHPSTDFVVTFQQITLTKASMRKAYDILCRLQALGLYLGQYEDAIAGPQGLGRIDLDGTV